MKCASLCLMGVITLVLILGGCGSSSKAPSSQVVPVSLSYDALFLDGAPATPTDDGAFAIPSNAAVPDDLFEGTLTLVSPERNGRFETLHDSFGVLGTGDSVWKHLPPFSFEFVQDGSYLIPVRQGLVYTGHATWNYIVGPGRVWKLASDSGYTRASFPFALIEMNQNCVHNGVMIFLFANNKSPNISKVRYQITQETCEYSKFNFWGQISATYNAHAVANAATIRSDHAAEVANRLPTKPISALSADFPGSGVNLDGFVSDHQHRDEITFYGLLINGVNYVSGCPTRYGEYAYCAEMRVPSYSTAKSAFNGVAMMRIGQLYGTGVYSQLIRDNVPEYTQGGDWSTTTFDNGLDMATGNFLSSGYMSDENGSENQSFRVAVPYTTKIGKAFGLFPHRADPGTIWVYQDVASFITNQAMNGFLQRQQGSGADIFDMVRDQVYKPLHLSQGGLTTLRTDNSDSGKAVGYIGLYYIPDDIAKIAKLLNNDNGMIDGIQTLDFARVQESLYRNPDALGLPVPDTGTPVVPNTIRYNNGFWAKHMTPAESSQYSCDFWVPYMSGAGGITVALLPNSATFYVFDDTNEYNWGNAAKETNKLVPYCR